MAFKVKPFKTGLHLWKSPIKEVGDFLKTILASFYGNRQTSLKSHEMKSFLSSIFIADIVATNGDWTAEDTIWFSERVVNNQFVTKIRDVTYDPLDDNVRISVSLIDTTHPTTDIYIEKQLVDEKRAVYLCV